MPEKTLIFGSRDYLQMVMPLSLFDELKDKLLPQWYSDEPTQSYQDALNAMRDIIGNEFEMFGEQLIVNLIHRWEVEDAKKDSQQVSG